jgi:hypothetical protein
MKKAQTKILENTATLMILIFIFIVVISGVVLYQTAKFKQDEQNQKDVLFAKKIKAIYSFPEFVCSDNGHVNPNCYDIHKIEIFKKKLETDQNYQAYYRDILGFTNISVQRFDPSPEINSWSYEREIFANIKPDFKSRAVFEMPILLRNSSNNGNYFGVLTLEIYS